MKTVFYYYDQVRLLKQGQQIPEELQTKEDDLQQRLNDQKSNTSTPNSTPIKDADDNAATLREKVVCVCVCV